MVVLGLIAFDYGITLTQTFPETFKAGTRPSVFTPVRAVLFKTSLITGHSDYDVDRLVGLNQAIDRLHRKSRSFYLASATFNGELRTDLILL